MKLVLLLLLTALASPPVSQAAPTPPKLIFVRDALPVNLAVQIRPEIIRDVLATLHATAYDSSSYAGNAEEWRRLSSGSYLVLNYQEPVEVIAFHGKAKVLVTDILIPVSKDDHYLVRNARTGEYRAFTKMLPKERGELICRQELLIEKNQQLCKTLNQLPYQGTEPNNSI